MGYGLILSRKRDEVIVITLPDGRLVEVMVVEIRGDRARIGVRAPEDITVNRLEVHEAIKAGEVRT